MRPGLKLVLAIVLAGQMALGAAEPPPPCNDHLATAEETRREAVTGSPIVKLNGEFIGPKFIEGEAARVIAEVKLRCGTSDACSDQDLATAINGAIDTQGKKSGSLLRSLFRYPRRLFVIGLYATTVIAPGLITYWATSQPWFHEWVPIPEGAKVILGSSISSMFAVVLGRAGSLLERMIGPHIEQSAMIIWDPNQHDSWGSIQKALNEKDRLTNSQVYNQIDVLRDHFMSGGSFVKEGNLTAAASHYAASLLHSHHLFGGLHFYHPSTVTEVRSWIGRETFARLTPEQKIELILLTCRELQNTPPDQLGNGVTRDELIKFAFGVMLRWLVVFPQSGPSGSAIAGGTTPTSGQALTAAVVPPRTN